MNSLENNVNMDKLDEALSKKNINISEYLIDNSYSKEDNEEFNNNFFNFKLYKIKTKVDLAELGPEINIVNKREHNIPVKINNYLNETAGFNVINENNSIEKGLKDNKDNIFIANKLPIFNNNNNSKIKEKEVTPKAKSFSLGKNNVSREKHDKIYRDDQINTVGSNKNISKHISNKIPNNIKKQIMNQNTSMQPNQKNNVKKTNQSPPSIITKKDIISKSMSRRVEIINNQKSKYNDINLEKFNKKVSLVENIIKKDKLKKDGNDIMNEMVFRDDTSKEKISKIIKEKGIEIFKSEMPDLPHISNRNIKFNKYGKKLNLKTKKKIELPENEKEKENKESNENEIENLIKNQIMNILNELKDSNIPNNNVSNIPIVNKSKNGFVNKIDKDEHEINNYYKSNTFNHNLINENLKDDKKIDLENSNFGFNNKDKNNEIVDNNKYNNFKNKINNIENNEIYQQKSNHLINKKDDKTYFNDNESNHSLSQFEYKNNDLYLFSDNKELNDSKIYDDKNFNNNKYKEDDNNSVLEDINEYYDLLTKKEKRDEKSEINNLEINEIGKNEIGKLKKYGLLSKVLVKKNTNQSENNINNEKIEQNVSHKEDINQNLIIEEDKLNEQLSKNVKIEISDEILKTNKVKNFISNLKKAINENKNSDSLNIANLLKNIIPKDISDNNKALGFENYLKKLVQDHISSNDLLQSDPLQWIINKLKNLDKKDISFYKRSYSGIYKLTFRVQDIIYKKAIHLNMESFLNIKYEIRFNFLNRKESLSTFMFNININENDVYAKQEKLYENQKDDFKQIHPKLLDLLMNEEYNTQIPIILYFYEEFLNKFKQTYFKLINKILNMQFDGNVNEFMLKFIQDVDEYTYSVSKFYITLDQNNDHKSNFVNTKFDKDFNDRQLEFKQGNEIYYNDETSFINDKLKNSEFNSKHFSLKDNKNTFIPEKNINEDSKKTELNENAKSPKKIFNSKYKENFDLDYICLIKLMKYFMIFSKFLEAKLLINGKSTLFKDILKENSLSNKIEYIYFTNRNLFALRNYYLNLIPHKIFNDSFVYKDNKDKKVTESLYFNCILDDSKFETFFSDGQIIYSSVFFIESKKMNIDNQKTKRKMLIVFKIRLFSYLLNLAGELEANIESNINQVLNKDDINYDIDQKMKNYKLDYKLKYNAGISNTIKKDNFLTNINDINISKEDKIKRHGVMNYNNIDFFKNDLNNIEVEEKGAKLELVINNEMNENDNFIDFNYELDNFDRLNYISNDPSLKRIYLSRMQKDYESKKYKTTNFKSILELNVYDLTYKSNWMDKAFIPWEELTLIFNKYFNCKTNEFSIRNVMTQNSQKYFDLFTLYLSKYLTINNGLLDFKDVFNLENNYRYFYDCILQIYGNFYENIKLNKTTVFNRNSLLDEEKTFSNDKLSSIYLFKEKKCNLIPSKLLKVNEKKNKKRWYGNSNLEYKLKLNKIEESNLFYMNNMNEESKSLLISDILFYKEFISDYFLNYYYDTNYMIKKSKDNEHNLNLYYNYKIEYIDELCNRDYFQEDEKKKEIKNQGKLIKTNLIDKQPKSKEISVNNKTIIVKDPTIKDDITIVEELYRNLYFKHKINLSPFEINTLLSNTLFITINNSKYIAIFTFDEENIKKLTTNNIQIKQVEEVAFSHLKINKLVIKIKPIYKDYWFINEIKNPEVYLSIIKIFMNCVNRDILLKHSIRNMISINKNILGEFLQINKNNKNTLKDNYNMNKFENENNNNIESSDLIEMNIIKKAIICIDLKDKISLKTERLNRKRIFTRIFTTKNGKMIMNFKVYSNTINDVKESYSTDNTLNLYSQNIMNRKKINDNKFKKSRFESEIEQNNNLNDQMKKKQYTIVTKYNYLAFIYIYNPLTSSNNYFLISHNDIESFFSLITNKKLKDKLLGSIDDILNYLPKKIFFENSIKGEEICVKLFKISKLKESNIKIIKSKIEHLAEDEIDLESKKYEKDLEINWLNTTLFFKCNLYNQIIKEPIYELSTSESILIFKIMRDYFFVNEDYEGEEPLKNSNNMKYEYKNSFKKNKKYKKLPCIISVIYHKQLEYWTLIFIFPTTQRKFLCKVYPSDLEKIPREYFKDINSEGSNFKQEDIWKFLILNSNLITNRENNCYFEVFNDSLKNLLKEYLLGTYHTLSDTFDIVFTEITININNRFILDDISKCLTYVPNNLQLNVNCYNFEIRGWSRQNYLIEDFSHLINEYTFYQDVITEKIEAIVKNNMEFSMINNNTNVGTTFFENNNNFIGSPSFKKYADFSKKKIKVYKYGVIKKIGLLALNVFKLSKVEFDEKRKTTVNFGTMNALLEKISYDKKQVNLIKNLYSKKQEFLQSERTIYSEMLMFNPSVLATVNLISTKQTILIKLYYTKKGETQSIYITYSQLKDIFFPYIEELISFTEKELGRRILSHYKDLITTNSSILKLFKLNSLSIKEN